MDVLINVHYLLAVTTFAAQTDGHHRTPHITLRRNTGGKGKIMENITYSAVGDYLLPNIALSDPKDAPPIGRYGKMRRAFLKEHKAIEYSRLLLTEKLFPHLREVDEIADERRRNGTPESVIIKEIVCEL
jgi:hypothetical protein